MKKLFKEKTQAKAVLPGLPIKEEESHLSRWTSGFCTRAAEEGSFEDCPPLSRPDEAPELPSDISTVQGDELGSLHARFAAYAAYLEEPVAQADLDADEREALLEHVQAKVRLTKSGTVADKNAKALNSEEYIEAEMAALSARAKAKLLKARLRGYDKITAGLSREITRRSEGQGR
jgi:hypothetical protein